MALRASSVSILSSLASIPLHPNRPNNNHNHRILSHRCPGMRTAWQQYGIRRHTWTPKVCRRKPYTLYRTSSRASASFLISYSHSSLSHSFLNAGDPASRNWLISNLISVGLTASTVSAAKAVYVQKWFENQNGMFVGFNTVPFKHGSEAAIEAMSYFGIG